MEADEIKNMYEYRRLANSDPLRLMELQKQMSMPVVNRALGGPLDNQMDEIKNKVDMVGPLALSNLVDIALGEEAQKDLKELEKQKEIEQLLAEQDQADADLAVSSLLPYAGDEIINMMAQGQAIEQGVEDKTGGGLMKLAAGGNFSGQVPGEGHGMEDNVFMPIVERERGKQVATLAVSPDEYVVDAYTMAALGNGSADAGAKVMDRVVDNVREKAYGTDKQPNEISGLASLRPMIERV